MMFYVLREFLVSFLSERTSGLFPVIFVQAMSSHHSDQMCERSQVSQSAHGSVFQQCVGRSQILSNKVIYIAIELSGNS